MPTRASICDCLGVHDSSSSIIHYENSLLQFPDPLLIKQSSEGNRESINFWSQMSDQSSEEKKMKPGFLGKRHVYDDDVTLWEHCIEIFLKLGPRLFLQFR